MKYIRQALGRGGWGRTFQGSTAGSGAACLMIAEKRCRIVDFLLTEKKSFATNSWQAILRFLMFGS